MHVFKSEELQMLRDDETRDPDLTLFPYSLTLSLMCMTPSLETMILTLPPLMSMTWNLCDTCLWKT